MLRFYSLFCLSISNAATNKFVFFHLHVFHHHVEVKADLIRDEGHLGSTLIDLMTPGKCSLWVVVMMGQHRNVVWCSHILKMILSIYRLRKNFGDAGYRSPCLSHAKRALYHLSYTPCKQYVNKLNYIIGFHQLVPLIVDRVHNGVCKVIWLVWWF